MRKLCVVAALAAVGLVVAAAAAQDKKAVKLEGKILCPHCALGEGTKCATAIQVKEKGKTVTYYFLDEGDKEKYHDEVCGGSGKPGSVTGVVSEKGGKKYITPKKVVYAKK
jgi:hypothetical protein